MAQSYYAKLPAYEVGAGLDFSPLTNAAANMRKANEFQQRQELEQERLGLQQQQVDMQRETHGEDMRTRKMKEIAGLAQLADQQQDPAQRASVWGKILGNYPEMAGALQKHGIDPSDHVQGPKFLIAQATGYRDPLDDKLKTATIAEKEAHAAALKAKDGPIIKDAKDPLVAIEKGPDGRTVARELHPGASGEKIPPAIMAEAIKANQAFTSLSAGLDDYAAAVKRTGAVGAPGKEKDEIVSKRRNLQLQMKELYNLGVLNGPDLELMDSMLVDPSFSLNPKTWTNAYDTSERVDASVTRMKGMLERLRDSKTQGIKLPAGMEQHKSKPSPPGSAEIQARRAIGGKNYFKQNGQWFEE